MVSEVVVVAKEDLGAIRAHWDELVLIQGGR
jgi:hypothetical protein